jgi:hypothetical protein
VNHSFRTLSSHRNRTNSGNNKSRECGGCFKAITLCLASYFFTTNDQCAGVLLCRGNQIFLLIFPSHCISEMTEDFDINFFVYSMPFFGMVTRRADRHWHSYGHHENVHAIHNKLSFLHYQLTICFFMYSWCFWRRLHNRTQFYVLTLVCRWHSSMCWQNVKILKIPVSGCSKDF